MIGPYVMDPLRFGTEFVYTLLVVLLCFLIYYSTREIYSLTNYKGIKYFRNAFLFFTVAYLFRFIFLIFQLILIKSDIYIPRWIIMPASLFLTSYLSTMAIIFLTYSLIWKKFDVKRFFLWANIFSLIVSLLVFFSREHIVLVISQGAIFLVGSIIGFSLNKKSKKHPKMFFIYLLIFLFWILNFFSLGPKRFFPIELTIITNVLSIVLFMVVYLRVKKWVS